MEEFFRKAVRQSDTTSMESDWQKMEKMLDAQQALRAARFKKILIRTGATVAILSILLLTTYQLTRPAFNNDITPSETVRTNAENSAQTPGKDAQVDTKQAPEDVADQLSGELKNGVTGNESNKDNNLNNAATDDDLERGVDNKLKQESKESLENSNRTGGGSDVSGPATRNVVQRSGRRSSTAGTSAVQTNANDKHAREVSEHSETADRAIQRAEQANGISLGKLKTSTENNDRDNSATDTANVHKLQAAKTEVSAFDKPLLDNSKTPTAQTENSNAFASGDEKKNGVSPEVINSVDSDSKSTSEAPDSKGQRPPSAVASSAADSLKLTETKAQPVDTLQKRDTETKEDEKAHARIARWSVALTAAPDFSATSFDKMTSPGSAYGLLIGYRVLNRVTISGGVIKTSKKYNGYGSDYQPPAGYWKARTNGIVPDEIQGQCSVIEIPLTIQFDVLRNTRSRLFASAGASSYRMLNESYRYTFYETNEGAADSWSSDKPVSYTFGIGHLSVGYERTIFRNVSLGLEPYVKIPFKGIGWSNVNLYTTGVYVNLRYTFQRKNF